MLFFVLRSFNRLAAVRMRDHSRMRKSSIAHEKSKVKTDKIQKNKTKWYKEHDEHSRQWYLSIIWRHRSRYHRNHVAASASGVEQSEDGEGYANSLQFKVIVYCIYWVLDIHLFELLCVVVYFIIRKSLKYLDTLGKFSVLFFLSLSARWRTLHSIFIQSK